tara:strand:+ start:3204 stop:3713 length:510 start_codon:yes stop_codon:yes gene_type:complete
VKKNLVLLGMMAVGKTTLAKIVAKNQNMQFIDIDKNIEKKNSMKIREIFEKKGENYFRTQEEKEVLESLKKNNCVIALGGGAFINQKIRENVLKNTISIWLDANIKLLSERTRRNQKRPLLKQGNSEKILKKLYEERKKIYKLANHKITCDKLNKKNLAKKIISLYEKY